MNNPTKGKWYKFNDIDVTEFDMTDTQLEEECFGGTYKAKVYEQCKYCKPIDLLPLVALHRTYKAKVYKQCEYCRIIDWLIIDC